MDQIKETGGEVQGRNKSSRSATTAPMLDSQFTELIEAVWACERAWKQENRIDAAIGG